MAISARQAAIFGAGLALGIAGAWIAFGDGLGAGSKPSHGAATAARPATAPAAAKPAPAAAAAPAPVGPASTATTAAPVVGAANPCPAQTATALSDNKDGQFQLQTDVAGKTEKDIAAFVVVGKEAAASGRARDAEVAFMMSCRVAEQHKGADSLPVADAKYQLARHYANLALHGGGGGNRAELMRRAERLYVDSLENFSARHGPTHEKTRFAAEGLAALRQPAGKPAGPVVAQAGSAPAVRPPGAAAAPAPAVTQGTARGPAPTQGTARPPAPPPTTAARAPAPVPAPAPAPAPATARAAPPSAATARIPAAPAVSRPQPPERVAMGGAAPAQARGSATASAAAEAAPPTPPLAAAQGSATAGADSAAPLVRPSFDCAKARSRAERIICSDAELARQDRELGRLYARARDAAPDAAAFRRRNESEWRRREATCSDRECLLRWYAQRRDQLNGDLDQAR